MLKLLIDNGLIRSASSTLLIKWICLVRLFDSSPYPLFSPSLSSPWCSTFQLRRCHNDLLNLTLPYAASLSVDWQLSVDGEFREIC